MARPRPKKPKWHTFLSGAFSGVTSAALLQPLDVVKTRQQGVRLRTQGAFEHVPLRAATQDILNMSGVRGLWRGVVPAVTRVFWGVGLYMVSLEHCLEVLNACNVQAGSSLIAGGAARALAGTVMYPISVVKTRFEWSASNTPNSSVRSALASIFSKEGVRGLYQGLPASLARDVPYSALYFAAYSHLNVFVREQSVVPTSVGHFGAGFVASVLATFVTHPADVVRTRQQLSSNPLSVASEVMAIARTEPVATFFRGVMPRLFRRGFATAITWTMYEYLKAS